MLSLKKIFIFIFWALLISLIGIAGGRLASDIFAPKTDAEIALKKTQKEQEKIAREKQRANYIAAPPAVGPLVIMIELKARYEEPDKAIATIAETPAYPFEKNQKVALYDKEFESVLPLGGRVQFVNKENGQWTLYINLPQGTNTDLLADKVGVIVYESTSSQRLPLSALQEDKTGNNFIWLARKHPEQKGKFFAQKMPLTILHKNESFFEPDTFDLEVDDLVIINPDSKINEETAYRIFQDTLEAPILNPIEQAWTDYELARLEGQQKRLEQAYIDCRNGIRPPAPGDITLPNGQTANTTPTDPAACGDPATLGRDPMADIFQSLIAQEEPQNTLDNTMPAPPNNAGGGCGGNACGQ